MQYQLSAVAVSITVAFSAPIDARNLNYVPISVPLANNYHTDVKLESYWRSEKLDGIRAVWTGHQLLTRNGKTIHAPDWFVAPLPDTPLEGELWAGRGNFHLVQQTVLDETPNSEAWRMIDYMLFDIPNSRQDYQNRYTNIVRLVDGLKQSHIKYVEHYPVRDEEELLAYLDAIALVNGEGVMLRRVDSYYQAGRSNDLLKLKKHQDAEARVIGYKMGKGKFDGQMGALLVQLPSGLQFYVGSGFSDVLRRNPPLLGSTITFRYNGYTHNGVPKFARFIRERID